MEILPALESFGLSEKEAKIYISCLELGGGSASDISLKTNIPRTLTYDLLERLIDLGLVSYSITNGKKFFTAADPKELIRALKEKERDILAVIPQLETLQKAKAQKRPKVEVYEGKEGMKTIMNEILSSGEKEFCVYGSSRSSFEVFPAFMEEWHGKRIKQKIIMKIIYNNTKEAREKVSTKPESLKHVFYRFSVIDLESPTATIICGNKVILQSWTKEPFAVAIENRDMADNQKRYFDELWKIASR